MKVFYDTEFSSLDHDAVLLSAGLVTENGAELYVEITDFDLTVCSGFVRESVLPLFGQGDQPAVKLTGQQFGIRLDYWLNQFAEPVDLISDHICDWQLVSQYWPDFRTFPRCFRPVLWKHEPANKPQIIAIRDAFWLANSGMEHHALYDARLLQALDSLGGLRIAL